MKEKLLAAGGALGAVASSTCCIVPLALASAGVGGAWVGNLTAMAPYQPIFLAIAIACLGAGFWMVYGRRQAACATGERAASGAGRVIGSILWVKGALWFGAVVVALSLGVARAGARCYDVDAAADASLHHRLPRMRAPGNRGDADRRLPVLL